MSGETIDSGAPYEFDDAGHDVNANWKDEIQPAKESDEKGFFVEPGGEGDVPKLITEVQGINPAHNPPKLNKRSLVMKLDFISEVDDHGNSFACFGHLGENGHNTDGLQMPVEVWEDFGRPDTLTVVAYPKDMLN